VGCRACLLAKEGRVIDRPLIELRVDIELDNQKGGGIRIRPTSADSSFDLKAYEELGCSGLPLLSDLMQREIRKAVEEGGISPFMRESFELILSSAATRLDPEGRYVPTEQTAPREPGSAANSPLTITDQWVLYARPRSQHVVLQDIDRLRHEARDPARVIEGVAERLVTDPSAAQSWKPLDATNGQMTEPPAEGVSLDTFFPKPFNDDQISIVRRLSHADGLVVQGPPGTGKTHTIANIICHTMATGQRVLVTSRGEPALAVLKEHLPKQVQQLAIAILSNEREGLKQVEYAIREIQSVVEGTSPEQRLTAIRRLETEIEHLRVRTDEIDCELDSNAKPHLSKIGPRNETPAEVARRLVVEREAFQWFIDRPSKFASETGLNELEMAALGKARRCAGKHLDHLHAARPPICGP
jgi:Rad3-related DNA helicase